MLTRCRVFSRTPSASSRSPSISLAPGCQHKIHAYGGRQWGHTLQARLRLTSHLQLIATSQNCIPCTNLTAQTGSRPASLVVRPTVCTAYAVVNCITMATQPIEDETHYFVPDSVAGGVAAAVCKDNHWISERNTIHNDMETITSNRHLHNDSENMPPQTVPPATFSFFADGVFPGLPLASHRSFARFSTSSSPSLYKIYHNVHHHTHTRYTRIKDSRRSHITSNPHKTQPLTIPHSTWDRNPTHPLQMQPNIISAAYVLPCASSSWNRSPQPLLCRICTHQSSQISKPRHQTTDALPGTRWDWKAASDKILYPRSMSGIQAIGPRPSPTAHQNYAKPQRTAFHPHGSSPHCSTWVSDSLLIQRPPHFDAGPHKRLVCASLAFTFPSWTRTLHVSCHVNKLRTHLKRLALTNPLTPTANLRHSHPQVCLSRIQIDHRTNFYLPSYMQLHCLCDHHSHHLKDPHPGS